jgi:malate/lactate dehydrogenase
MRNISDITTENDITPLPLQGAPIPRGRKLNVSILALGDVGTTMLIGLRLLGGDRIGELRICDINQDNLSRLEMEINQIRYPFCGEAQPLPPVRPVGEEELFTGDVFIFTASKGVPALGVKGDVRLAQLDANRGLILHFAELARKADYRGFCAIVSDPVDPLAKAFLGASGLDPVQVQGYGLGVMSASAEYYAERDSRFRSYLTEGRAFGPHGEDLVIANSIEHYDDALSRELTRLAAHANMTVRDLGYKPYIAPALSSAAISILLTLRGEWHYSSLYFGDGENGAFLGIRNRMTDRGAEYEDPAVSDALFARVLAAYNNLLKL